MIPSASYPTKILLLGEYSVLNGSDALACPLPLKSGKLKYACASGKRPPEAQKSQQSLIDLFSHLEKISRKSDPSESYNSEQFRNDLISGLFFDSDIPIRYGIGSSGALVVAIYGAYFDQSKEKPIELLIKSLGLIESHFHKYSSGIDPLVSFLSKSIHITNLTPQVVPFNLDWIRDNFGLFLIDNGMSASTRKGIDRNRKEIQHEEYTPLNNSIIQKILSQNDNNLFQDFMRLSYLQSLHFQDLFSPEILNLCKEGHSNSEYAIKLCGSGGGGYFFLISPQTKQIPDNIIHSGFSIIPL